MRLRRRAEQLVHQAGCIAGDGLAEIHAKVARFHRKEVVLQPLSAAQLSQLTGLWLEGESVSYVFYRANDPLVYQAHSIFHEFGHIIADHRTCGVLEFIDMDAIGKSSLGGEIQRARARGFRHDTDEDLAEEIAYALSRLVLAQPSPGLRAAFE